MNAKGRPPKPANKKRPLLSATVSYEAYTAIRQYAADNSLELSATVDRAILEFLKAQSAPIAAIAPVAVVTPIAPAQIEQPKAARTPKAPKHPIEGISPKKYAEVCEALRQHLVRTGPPIDTHTFFKLAELGSGAGYKYIKQLTQDKILKKHQSGVYGIIPENLPLPASIP